MQRFGLDRNEPDRSRIVLCEGGRHLCNLGCVCYIYIYIYIRQLGQALAWRSGSEYWMGREMHTQRDIGGWNRCRETESKRSNQMFLFIYRSFEIADRSFIFLPVCTTNLEWICVSILLCNADGWRLSVDIVGWMIMLVVFGL